MKFITSSLFIGAFIMVSLLGCKSNDPAQNSNGLIFYYYPKTNVYYDISNASYIYSIDSGRNWTSLLDTSKKRAEQLGKKYIIRSNTSDIWKDNETHRKMYGGTLINLVKRDSGTNKTLVTKPKPLIKKNKMVLNEDSILQADQPRKKRTFFQRLFGKKKRKKNPEQEMNTNTISN